MNLRSIDPEVFLLLQRELLGDVRCDIGISDEGLLDAAFSYPLHHAVMRHADVADLAAAYAIGILRYRPFMVGNESAALLAMGLFLYLNDWELSAPQEEVARIIWQASAANLDEDELADWIRQNL